jgi:hypothetical protein
VIKVSDWVGRMATNLIAPRSRIEALMYDLGGRRMVLSTESAPYSVWVGDDQAPNGRAGYYTRHHEPLDHRIVTDGATVVVEFSYHDKPYRIQSGSAATPEGNLRLIALLLESCVQFVQHGFVTWEAALQPFVRAADGQAQGGAPGPAWWSVLRLPPDATDAEVEAAYRAQARKHHPDAGGTHEGFLRVQAAYQAAQARKR